MGESNVNVEQINQIAKSNSFKIEELQKKVNNLEQEQRVIYRLVYSIESITRNLDDIRENMSELKEGQKELTKNVKDDINEIKNSVKEDIKSFKDDINNLRNNISNVQDELENEINDIKQQPYNDFIETKKQIKIKTIVGFISGILISFATYIVAFITSKK